MNRDTVDHQRLLDILKNRIGITDTALQWFSSYLSGRTETVQVPNGSSAEAPMRFGVPQGSVLGPILFTIYTIGLDDIMQKHDLNYHLYADDTQLYVEFKPNAPGETLIASYRMEQCVKDIHNWTSIHFLKINDDKSKAIVFRPRNQQPSALNIRVGEEIITTSHSVRNLGVSMDERMLGEAQVNAAIKGAFFHIRQIGKIRRFLTSESAASVIHAFVSSRLDYCNSLYYGLPTELIDRLKKVQNTAARIVSRSARFSRITPTLQALHWLPVRQRVQYKILLLTFKALHGLASEYLSNLLEHYSCACSLRSNSRLLLKPSTARLKSYGERSFSYAAPKLWNTLPAEIQNCDDIDVFKRLLKTKLFKDAYC